MYCGSKFYYTIELTVPNYQRLLNVGWVPKHFPWSRTVKCTEAIIPQILEGGRGGEGRAGLEIVI